MDLKEIGCGMDLSGSEWRPVAGSCGRSNEPGSGETVRESQAPAWSSTNVETADFKNVLSFFFLFFCCVKIYFCRSFINIVNINWQSSKTSYHHCKQN
jgi:hypothetical protein